MYVPCMLLLTLPIERARSLYGSFAVGNRAFPLAMRLLLLLLISWSAAQEAVIDLQGQLLATKGG